MAIASIMFQLEMAIYNKVEFVFIFIQIKFYSMIEKLELNYFIDVLSSTSGANQMNTIENNDGTFFF